MHSHYVSIGTHFLFIWRSPVQKLRTLEQDCLVLIDTLKWRALSRILNGSVPQFPQLGNSDKKKYLPSKIAVRIE